MIKQSQATPAPAPATPPATTPPAGGATTNVAPAPASTTAPMMPFAGGGAAGPAAVAVSDPSVADEIIYTGLNSPEDVFKDYRLLDKIQQEDSNIKIANDIWSLYGGAMFEVGNTRFPGVGADPDKIGKRPKEGYSSQVLRDKELKETEDKRWERLEAGISISDIWRGFSDLEKSITNYEKAFLAALAKQQQTASSKFSWYRYARGQRQ